MTLTRFEKIEKSYADLVKNVTLFEKLVRETSKPHAYEIRLAWKSFQGVYDDYKQIVV